MANPSRRRVDGMKRGKSYPDPNSRATSEKGQLPKSIYMPHPHVRASFLAAYRVPTRNPRYSSSHAAGEDAETALTVEHGITHITTVIGSVVLKVLRSSRKVRAQALAGCVVSSTVLISDISSLTL